MKKKITIEVWADINCPFCYIAEAMLARVLREEALPDAEVEVHWRSCRLHPHMPIGDVLTWKEMLAGVTSPAEVARYKEGDRMLQEMAKPYGLVINNEGTKLHNSYDAARLLKLATKHQLVLPVAKAFGEGFFTEGLDMSRHEHLRRKAVEAGLPEDEVDTLLAGDLYGEDVERDQVLAQRYAPSFIPVLYFNGGNPVAGVVSEDELRQALLAAYEEEVQ